MNVGNYSGVNSVQELVPRLNDQGFINNVEYKRMNSNGLQRHSTLKAHSLCFYRDNTLRATDSRSVFFEQWKAIKTCIKSICYKFIQKGKEEFSNTFSNKTQQILTVNIDGKSKRSDKE